MRAPVNCLYCGAVAATKDHVIARCLLEKPYPLNLPTVPSCRSCNEGFSRDEQYFLAVLAQAGFTTSLTRKVEDGGVVDRMLQRSPALDAYFANSLHIGDQGRIFITPDETRIANVARKIALGLYYHRYAPRTPPALDDFLALKPLHTLANSNFMFILGYNERIKPRRWNHLQTLVIPGRRKIQIFDYMFVRNWVWADIGRLFCIMRFHETVWAAVRCPNPPHRTNARWRKLRDDRQGEISF